ncbi:cell wall metabolism sensor histidine kinase WalK [Cellulomonas sp. PhB150]|uniref:sensor histidine kinase n=1 Tax=Cellulomonas sp. PhB150 TaxID=2485188 RepID=UPI000F46789F|nr:HAMP domain-containing sensor histidine kinase [Cellulomonas sp. PhB150]ROS25809.1 two-component system OmpR family sensor kinase [Cellulomonas sp. PhB150]
MTAEAPLAPAPPAARTRRFARTRARWDRMPLVGRLISITTVLLAVGLLVAGAVATTLLQRSLIDQIDSKLQTEGVASAKSTFNPFGAGSDESHVPTDYYLQLTDLDGVPAHYVRESVSDTWGTPKVPAYTVDEALARHGEPFTVDSDQAGSSWRVVVYPVTQGQQLVGTIAVGLPLGGVQETVRTMLLVLVFSGIAIVAAGALAGRWAVRRSLRPLREIEATAEAIADGDLTQRVPAAPASTEVGRLGAALNTMLAQIEQAFDARTTSEARMRRFVADASHELRTPLASIRGYGELYRMGALTEREQVDDTMRRIEDSATRMGGLVEDLLSLARLDEGRPLQSTPVDLTVLAADALSDLHALDPSRTPRLVPLVEGASTGPCVVVGDEPRLRQVLSNLVGNAARHTPPGTAVEIAVGTDGEHGVLEVRDHGPGIDPEHAARVFERFYRVDASRGRSSGGSGLGMAIVAAIVAAHEGSVALFETPGGGTTVRVALPIGGAPVPDRPSTASPGF